MDAALDGLGVYSLKCVLVNVEIQPVLFGTTHSQKEKLHGATASLIHICYFHYAKSQISPIWTS